MTLVSKGHNLDGVIRGKCCPTFLKKKSKFLSKSQAFALHSEPSDITRTNNNCVPWRFVCSNLVSAFEFGFPPHPQLHRHCTVIKFFSVPLLCDKQFFLRNIKYKPSLMRRAEGVEQLVRHLKSRSRTNSRGGCVVRSLHPGENKVLNKVIYCGPW